MSDLTRAVPISLQRRLAIATVSIAICAMLFRAQLSVAVVGRGDGFLQRGQLARAMTYYKRALWIDRSSTLAADRFAFVGYQIRTQLVLQEAIAVSSRALLDSPNDVQLLFDRAMCHRLLHQDREALRDFSHVATVTHDPRMFRFAAWAAYRTGQKRLALLYWQLALARDPSSVIPLFARHPTESVR